MTNITKRILDIKTLRGINDHQLEIGAELPPASTRAWRNGRKNSKGDIVEINPSAESVIKVARFLNVSADYLLCLTDEPTPLDKNLPTQRPAYAVSYTNEFDKIIQDPTFVNISKLYTKLESPQDKGVVFGFILDLAKHSGIDTKAVVGY